VKKYFVGNWLNITKIVKKHVILSFHMSGIKKRIFIPIPIRIIPPANSILFSNRCPTLSPR